MSEKNIILIDLPTFPKGIVSLSIPIIAACFKKYFEVKAFDLNIDSFDATQYVDDNTLMVGMKVSSQNASIATELTQMLKRKFPSLKIVWGGEYPSLLPEECLKHAHSVVAGLLEPVSDELSADLLSGNLKMKYVGKNENVPEMMPVPDFSVLPPFRKYLSFMGLPLETSRGCTENCMFCMVLVMQKKNYYLKPVEQLSKEIKLYDCKFINIVDYNFGVSKEHVINVSRIIKSSGALGWMAEMCIELLDDDELLQEMSRSRCRMIYCGLESIEEETLSSFNKDRTNHVENYERIIRKAQSYGIQIAAGLILGAANTTPQTFIKTFDFFQKMGIIYTKLTFLTYNPGTRVQEYMRKKGIYLTDKHEEYDGVRFSFLSEGVEKGVVLNGFEYYVREFYSITNILKRALKTNVDLLGKAEFFLFSYCYADVYRKSIVNNYLRFPENFDKLLISKHQPSFTLILMQKLLFIVRVLRKK